MGAPTGTPDVHTLLMEKVFPRQATVVSAAEMVAALGRDGRHPRAAGCDNLWNGYRVRSLGVQSLKATHA